MSLAEIAAAFHDNTPLVLACGKRALRYRGGVGDKEDVRPETYFETNTPLLYNMQFLVDVEKVRREKNTLPFPNHTPILPSSISNLP